jgi:hypothetical protein
VDYGSFDSGFFCLVGRPREDPYHDNLRKRYAIVVD